MGNSAGDRSLTSGFTASAAEATSSSGPRGTVQIADAGALMSAVLMYGESLMTSASSP